MKIKQFPLLLMITISLSNVTLAQESHFCIRAGTGNINTKLLYNEDYQHSSTNEYGIGAFYEYVPKNAMISFTGGFEYLINGKYLLIPLNIKFNGGKKLIFNVHGGPVPIFPLNPSAPDRTMFMGANAGTGFDYKLNAHTIVFIGIDFYSIRYYYYPPSHWGKSEKEKEISGGFLGNIGIKFKVPQKDNSGITPTG